MEGGCVFSRRRRTYLDSGAALDVLVNNAGLAGQRGVTQDGFELQFGTNHLGPFLFTLLLLPRIRGGTGPRIVNVSSRGHYRAKGIDWDAHHRSVRKQGPPRCGLTQRICGIFQGVRESRRRSRTEAYVN